MIERWNATVEDRAVRIARDEWFDEMIAYLVWSVTTEGKLRKRSHASFLPPHRTPDAVKKRKEAAMKYAGEKIAASAANRRREGKVSKRK